MKVYFLHMCYVCASCFVFISCILWVLFFFSSMSARSYSFLSDLSSSILIPCWILLPDRSCSARSLSPRGPKMCWILCHRLLHRVHQTGVLRWWWWWWWYCVVVVGDDGAGDKWFAKFCFSTTTSNTRTITHTRARSFTWLDTPYPNNNTLADHGDNLQRNNPLFSRFYKGSSLSLSLSLARSIHHSFFLAYQNSHTSATHFRFRRAYRGEGGSVLFSFLLITTGN